MDEPEAALSLTSCLALVGLLDRLARGGAQVLCATHSPLLTALPGATVLQLDSGASRRWPGTTSPWWRTGAATWPNRRRTQARPGLTAADDAGRDAPGRPVVA